MYAGEIMIALAWVTMINSLLMFLLLRIGGVETHDFAWTILLGIAWSFGLYQCGKGICNHAQWSRTLGAVIALTMFIAFPIGTALGATIIWCLIEGWHEEVFSRVPERVLTAISLIVVTLVPIAMAIAIPQFAVLFNEFGTDLPELTAIVVKFYAMAFVLPALMAIAWAVLRNRPNRVLLMFTAVLISSTAVVNIVSIAIYLPIYTLGAVVS